MHFVVLWGKNPHTLSSVDQLKRDSNKSATMENGITFISSPLLAYTCRTLHGARVLSGASFVKPANRIQQQRTACHFPLSHLTSPLSILTYIQSTWVNIVSMWAPAHCYWQWKKQIMAAIPVALFFVA